MGNKKKVREGRGPSEREGRAIGEVRESDEGGREEDGWRGRREMVKWKER